MAEREGAEEELETGAGSNISCNGEPQIPQNFGSWTVLLHLGQNIFFILR